MPVSTCGLSRIGVVALASCLVLAGCGGGGGGSVAPSATATQAGGGTSSKSTGNAAATLSVSFQQYTPVQTSSTKRAAKFVSPATQSIVLALVSVNGSTPSSSLSTTVNLGASATGCTTVGAIVTCTTSFSAPVGNDVMSATSYSGTNGGGSQLGTAQIAATIAQNAANDVALSIGGNIASLQIYLAQSSFTAGTSGKSLLIVVPLDASGAQIVNPGNYNPSIVVTSSDTTGNFGLVLDGGGVTQTATIASPNDQVVLEYGYGGVLGHASTTITATAGTVVASTNAYTNGAPGLNTGIGGNYTASTGQHFQFTALGQTGTLTVSGGTPPYTVVSSDPTVAAVSGTSSSYTITAAGYGMSGGGTATITVTDSSTPNPATNTWSVVVVPSPITATVASCGSAATCTSTALSFPTTTAAGASLTSTYTLGGGITTPIPTYGYQFVSSGTTTSQFATATLSGSTLTIAPNGAGSDVVLVTSGSQTYLIAVNAVAPATAAYTISSAVHAYSPSANALTMSYNSSAGNNATATLSFANGTGPWTVTSSNPSVVSVASSESGEVLTAAGAGTATVTLTPTVGSAPSPLAVTVIPTLSVSPGTIALHATGDGFSVTVSNATSGGLALGSSITESSGGTVIDLSSFSAGTLSGHAVTSPADATGASTITFHDTNVDRKVTATVNLDDGFDLALRSSIDDLNIAGTQQSTIGLIDGIQSTFSMPSTVTSATITGGSISTFTFTAGSPGSLVLLPTAANNGTIRFGDSAGGSVSYPFDAFGLTFAYPGLTLPTPVNEAFTSTSQSDAIAVSGTTGAISAASSNTSVVTVSVAGTTLTLQPTGPGYATVTVEDNGTTAAATFKVAVTSTTIPISSRSRR